DTSSGTITFTDPDLNDTHTASASAPTFAWSGGTLTAAQEAALAAARPLTLSKSDSTGSGAGSITFSYGAADKTFDFLALGQTLTISYQVTIDDHNGGTATQPVTITVTGIDEPPVLSNVAATASYTAVNSNPASATPVTPSPNATVSDVDNLTLASAKVSITSGLLAGDVLAFTNTDAAKYGNITAIYNNAGVLTLTSAGATATLAQWQAALDAVQYSSTSDNP